MVFCIHIDLRVEARSTSFCLFRGGGGGGGAREFKVALAWYYQIDFSQILYKRSLGHLDCRREKNGGSPGQMLHNVALKLDHFRCRKQNFPFGDNLDKMALSLVSDQHNCLKIWQ